MVVRLERLAAKALEWILTVMLFKGFFFDFVPRVCELHHNQEKGAMVRLWWA